jgi:hypothetical protein
VELLELGVFGGENLEWSCFFGFGALWSSPKHALYIRSLAVYLEGSILLAGHRAQLRIEFSTPTEKTFSCIP